MSPLKTTEWQEKVNIWLASEQRCVTHIMHSAARPGFERTAVFRQELILPSRTIYLARLLGLFLLILGVGEFTQGSAMVQITAEIVNAPALMLISGMGTVVAGLAIVLGHNVWRGGVLPAIVTILGWLMLIRGVGLIVVPAPGWAGAMDVSRYLEYYPVWVAIPLILGAYLTIAGFVARGSESAKK
jgi:hypothetical protein